MLPVLRDELATHRARHASAQQGGYMFSTATGSVRGGGKRDKDNVRERALRPVVQRADELLEDRQQQPLPDGVTPHKLRPTFASILAALNRPLPDVMHQLGHADGKFTLRVYAHAMRRGDDEREALRALVEGDTRAILERDAVAV